MPGDDGPAGPDLAHARQVEAMAGYGIPAAEIALVLGIAPARLERDYALELRTAPTRANARVAEGLFRKALGDGAQSVTAAIFWLKTRAGWRETNVPEGQARRAATELTDEELDAAITRLTLLLESQTDLAPAVPPALRPAQAGMTGASSAAGTGPWEPEPRT